MKLSDDGESRLEFREGARLRAYKDSKGVWTIGIGHTGPEVVEGLEWTHQQVIEAFKKDIRWAEECVNNSVEVPLNQNQFDALVSFVFNIGAPAFEESTLLKKLNLGDYTGAAAQFDRWVIPVEVTGRRMGEKKQFLS